MAGNGGRGLLTMVVAALTFLVVESVLFVGPALLNRAEDEAWLRSTLVSTSYYATEGGVLLIGGLLSAVWTGGAWFVLLFVPIALARPRLSALWFAPLAFWITPLAHSNGSIWRTCLALAVAALIVLRSLAPAASAAAALRPGPAAPGPALPQP